MRYIASGTKGKKIILLIVFSTETTGSSAGNSALKKVSTGGVGMVVVENREARDCNLGRPVRQHAPRLPFSDFLALN